jgi:ABC-type amino acid transport substrate-binding protein
MNMHIFCRLVFIFFLALTVCPAQAVDKGPKGVARVGVFPFEPLNFIDEKGVAQGLYPDLLREIVKDEKWAVEFVPGSWAEGLERLQRGEIDLILSVAYSPERAESMDFTFESVAELWGQVFFKPNSKLKNINNLEGHRVAITSKDISGSNFIATAEKLGVHCEIVEFPTHGKVFAAVQEGKVDAGVAPQHFGLRHAREFNLIGSSIIFSPFSIYFASKKGTQHELLSHIDAHLSSWKKEPNSFYYERIDSWLGSRSLKTKIPTWLIYSS